MRFGPFPHRDLERIEKTLSDSNIVYHVHHDPELLQAQLEEWKNQPPLGTRGRALEPAADFVEIEEGYLDRLGTQLESYGILANVEEPDFETVEDWYCIECEHHSENPGICPTHKTPLVDSATFHKKREENLQGEKQTTLYWALGVIAAGGGGYLLWRWLGA